MPTWGQQEQSCGLILSAKELFGFRVSYLDLGLFEFRTTWFNVGLLGSK